MITTLPLNVGLKIFGRSLIIYAICMLCKGKQTYFIGLSMQNCY